MAKRNTPTLADVFHEILDARLADVHVSIPARVESYDKARQSVAVKPMIRQAVPSAQSEGDERAVEDLPVINGVPVMFMSAGAFSITMPIEVGCTGLLVFSESSLDKWKSTGRDVDPLDDRRHTLSDAVFYPGLRAFGGSGSAGPIPSDGVSDTAMVFRAPLIHAGGSQALALADHTHSLSGVTFGGDSAVGTLGASDSNTTVLKGG